MSFLSLLPRMRRGLFALAVLATGSWQTLSAQQPPVPPLPVTYSGLVVFGDSLSDTGNFAATTEDDFGLRYPDLEFNYADGRFTSSTDTYPANVVYQGVWHEQLCTLFLGLPTARASLDGGTDYAFGDAETTSGQREVDVTDYINVHIDNLGRQVANYITKHKPDPAALFVVWAGANDLFAADDAKGANATKDNAAAVTAAANVTSNVERLARAGAVNFLVNNLPPLGETPEYSSQPDSMPRLNAAALLFRDSLNADLDNLLARLAADGIVINLKRLDVYDLFTRLLSSGGAAYGLSNITDSSQGENVRADRNLFWDGVHPTAAGHFQIAAEAFSVLTGIPVVELNARAAQVDRNSGKKGAFFLTRTGPDVSAPLEAYYTVGGTAMPGRDYVALRGYKVIAAGARTQNVVVAPEPAPAGRRDVSVRLTLQPDPAYALPAVTTGSLRLHVD